jgi:hypothetical protein
MQMPALAVTLVSVREPLDEGVGDVERSVHVWRRSRVSPLGPSDCGRVSVAVAQCATRCRRLRA